MSGGHVLYLSDYQLLVYRVEGRRVEVLQRFNHTGEGIDAFGAYLKTRPFRQVTLLVNSRFEEYKLTRVPRLMVGDRRSLLSHKRKRMFPATPYSYALMQGTEARAAGQARAQDKILFAALSNPDLLRPWISRLLAREIAINAICSLPLLSIRMIKYLPPAEHMLVVTNTRQTGEYNPYGLRQLYFYDGQLTAGRLIPLQTLDPKRYAEYVFGEIFKTQQYLQGQSLLFEEYLLTVTLLVPPMLIKPLQEYLATHKPGPSLKYFLLDITQLAETANIEIKESVEDWKGGPFFSSLLAWYAWYKHKNHYGQPHETRYYFYANLRRGLFALAGATALGLFGYGGTILWSALETRHNALQAEQNRIKMEARYRLAQDQQHDLLGVPVDVLHIRNTVDLAEYLHNHDTDPVRALYLFSRHFKDYTDLELTTLTWESTQRPVQSKRKGGGLMHGRRPKAQKMEDVEVLEMMGTVSGFEGNILSAIRTVKHFANALQEEKFVDSVEIVESPLQAGKKGNLKGELGMKRERPKEAKFGLKITFKFETH